MFRGISRTDTLVAMLLTGAGLCAAVCTAEHARAREVPHQRPRARVHPAAQPPLRFDPGELPGRYYFGDGLGVNCTLELDPGGRFSFSWHGCEGEYDRNEGTWSRDGDLLELHPERPYRQQGFRGMDVRFVPVKWGPRILLVDEHCMPGFCAAAARAEPPADE